MNTLNDRMNEALRERLAGFPALQLPPPCFVDMHAEVLDWVDGERLHIRFPVLPRYQNPLGYMQGGFVAAAVDNTIGPFSYLCAPPSVTTQFSLNYLRPVAPEQTSIECRARLLERAGKTLIYQAQVLGSDGKVLVLAQATTQLV